MAPVAPHALTKSDHQKLRKRRLGLLKKAQELSVLCNVDVILICYTTTPGGDALATWPEDPSVVRAAVNKYVERKRAKRVKESLDPSAFDRAGNTLKSIKHASDHATNDSSWPSELDQCSSETLASLLSHLERKISLAEARMAQPCSLPSSGSRGQQAPADDVSVNQEVVQNQALPVQPLAVAADPATSENVAAGRVCDVDLSLSLGWPYC